MAADPSPDEVEKPTEGGNDTQILIEPEKGNGEAAEEKGMNGFLVSRVGQTMVVLLGW